MSPEWIWIAFIAAFGACVGSFLNVVIYRLPRDKSLVSPGSACPSCDTPIRFYDNIPLVSWLALGGKCRICKAAISIRYFIVELTTAVLFVGLYLWFFWWQYRQTGLVGNGAMERFFSGGWLIYLNVACLTAAFLAASAIDLELWVIPIGICWFVTAIGLAASAAAGWVIDPLIINYYDIFPAASVKQAAITSGTGIGLVFSLIALRFGWIKPSYPYPEGHEKLSEDKDAPQPEFDDRREMYKEILFLLPAIVGGIIGLLLVRGDWGLKFFENALQVYAIKGFMGALAGYLAGCAVVWATRIFGTLAFGREAMGLGDVHLMGAAGAVVGPAMAVLAFFIAPFFGLGWAIYQWVFKKNRQIPYGPFLSLAVFLVIIFHDRMKNMLMNAFGY